MAEKGAFVEAIGRIKGDRNTKVHAISDVHCRCLAFCLTPCLSTDVKGAVILSDALPDATYLLADKAYAAADHWRVWLKRWHHMLLDLNEARP